MANPPPGYAFLSTTAILEHPREGDAQGDAFVTPITFDALLPCPIDSGMSPIVCNARYMQRVGERVKEGIYDVLLKVNTNLYFLMPGNTLLS